MTHLISNIDLLFSKMNEGWENERKTEKIYSFKIPLYELKSINFDWGVSDKTLNLKILNHYKNEGNTFCVNFVVKAWRLIRYDTERSVCIKAYLIHNIFVIIV